MSEEYPPEDFPPVDPPVDTPQDNTSLSPSVFRFVDPGVIAIAEILVPPPNTNPS